MLHCYTTSNQGGLWNHLDTYTLVTLFNVIQNGLKIQVPQELRDLVA